MSFVSSLAPGYPSGVPPYAPEVDGGSVGVAEVPAAQAVGYATATFAISGTAGDGNILTVNINSLTATYTMSGDTNDTAATGLATAIGNVAGLAAIVSNSHALNVVTVQALVLGPAGMYPITASATGSSTLTPSGTTLDFAGNFIIPNQTFSWADSNDSGATTFYAGIPAAVTPGMKARIIAAGLAT